MTYVYCVLPTGVILISRVKSRVYDVPLLESLFLCFLVEFGLSCTAKGMQGCLPALAGGSTDNVGGEMNLEAQVLTLGRPLVVVLW